MQVTQGTQWGREISQSFNMILSCGESRSDRPLHFGGICDTNVILWHYKEHNEPIQLLSG